MPITQRSYSLGRAKKYGFSGTDLVHLGIGLNAAEVLKDGSDDEDQRTTRRSYSDPVKSTIAPRSRSVLGAERPTDCSTSQIESKDFVAEPTEMEPDAITVESKIREAVKHYMSVESKSLPGDAGLEEGSDADNLSTNDITRKIDFCDRVEESLKSTTFIEAVKDALRDADYEFDEEDPSPNRGLWLEKAFMMITPERANIDFHVYETYSGTKDRMLTRVMLGTKWSEKDSKWTELKYPGSNEDYVVPPKVSITGLGGASV